MAGGFLPNLRRAVGVVATFSIVLAAAACSTTSGSGPADSSASGQTPLSTPDSLPPKQGDDITPTDYSDTNNWLYVDTSLDKKVDIFYLYPTVWERQGSESYLGSLDSNSPTSIRGNAPSTFNTQATAYMPAGNVFAPYYRQMDVQWTLTLPAADQDAYLLGAPYTDALAAFKYYLEHYNNGRPFILAGHSQGSNVLKFILTNYLGEHPDVYARMVAAYIIGFSVTQADLDNYPHLKFAENRTDTGVIISWNTEAPDMEVKNPVVQEGALAINPLSWTRRTQTVAAALNPGSRIFNDDGTYVDKYDLCDATVNPERGTVNCSTVNPDDYVIGDGSLFPKGVYHGMDYGFYWHAIEQNAVARADAFTAGA
ncbi:MAG: DUF3089 domain-containing protein [Propionibacteriaceae bacterium]|jgi:hypothetical protein|nr:DUF3089 domain-containing protein [Propionibacteriaceae bacterium]